MVLLLVMNSSGVLVHFQLLLLNSLQLKNLLLLYLLSLHKSCLHRLDACEFHGVHVKRCGGRCFGGCVPEEVVLEGFSSDCPVAWPST